MNYRHLFHAGNFADVVKHALLVQLLRALQKKEKGFLFLDTHAGRGRYDLSQAMRGDSLARRPEWPDGIGRVLRFADAPAASGAEGNVAESAPASSLLADYVGLVRAFDLAQGNRDAALRFYPGSPALAQVVARQQDRLALCERHAEEHAALAEAFAGARRTSVHEMDGYVALRAMLPPPERRALVLIDPPYEEQDEHERIAGALSDGLGRLPSGLFCVWYPLTERARPDTLLAMLPREQLPPTLVLELAVAGEGSGLKMRGCGMVVINPPWQFEATAGPLLELLAPVLAQGTGAAARMEWLVSET